MAISLIGEPPSDQLECECRSPRSCGAQLLTARGQRRRSPFLRRSASFLGTPPSRRLHHHRRRRRPDERHVGHRLVRDPLARARPSGSVLQRPGGLAVRLDPTGLLAAALLPERDLRQCLDGVHATILPQRDGARCGLPDQLRSRRRPTRHRRSGCGGQVGRRPGDRSSRGRREAPSRSTTGTAGGRVSGRPTTSSPVIVSIGGRRARRPGARSRTSPAPSARAAMPAPGSSPATACANSPPSGRHISCAAMSANCSGGDQVRPARDQPVAGRVVQRQCRRPTLASGPANTSSAGKRRRSPRPPVGRWCPGSRVRTSSRPTGVRPRGSSGTAPGRCWTRTRRTTRGPSGDPIDGRHRAQRVCADTTIVSARLRTATR